MIAGPEETVRALSIAWKDIRHTYRSVAGVVMMLVAPLALAFVLSLAFGSGDSFSIAAVRTVVVDQDQGAGAGMPAAGATLDRVLTSAELRRPAHGHQGRHTRGRQSRCRCR